MVRSGSSSLLVSGITTSSPQSSIRVGYLNGQTDIQIDSRQGLGKADLLAAFGIQAIDSEIHNLVRGPPVNRRQLLDWGVFHVKHGYLDDWRRFRRALVQRNAMLRTGADPEALTAWDHELVTAAIRVDSRRAEHIQGLASQFRQLAQQCLGVGGELEYLRGWPPDQDLAACLSAHRSGDLERGTTQVGPQRADLRVLLDDHASRNWASRGQQKLLGAALILAQTYLVAAAKDSSVALMVDEPAADLDRGHLHRLMQVLEQAPVQLLIATLDAESLPISGERHLFHVEHNSVKPLI